MEKSRNLILKEAKELRQEYYFHKQKLIDFKTLFNQFEDSLIKNYFEGEGIEDCDSFTYFNALSIIKKDKEFLAQLKAELNKLPHISNKQERKVIRQLKHKSNANK